MKLRTSFFNKTVFRKDISRFAPAWGIYLIGGLMVMLSMLTDHRADYAAQNLGETIGPFSVINLCYALLTAELLFGDLFNSRLCNALHALPLRREAWFGTHAAAGLCFSLVPHLIGALCLMPTLGRFWYVGLLWWLGMTLEYLFFFGVAVFSAFCTGNRFAMAAVYALINFFSILAAWFVETLYEPLLWGIEISEGGFMLFCPVVLLCTEMGTALVQFERAGSLYASGDTAWRFVGLDASAWWYLAILAGIGLVLMAVALLIYRRRALESAGDFIAVRPLNPVFSAVFTLTVGAAFQVFSDLFFNEGNYVFLVVGLALGYFAAQMLLRRTVRVFYPKMFLRFGILTGALVLSLVVTWLDPLGITRYVPETENVDLVSMNGVETDDPEEIRDILDIHQVILDSGVPERNNLFVSFSYRLKNGTYVDRNYYILADSAAGERLKSYFSTPEYVLDYSDWDAFLDSITEIYVDGNPLEVKDAQGVYRLELYEELLEAIKADCEAGKMAQEWSYHQEQSVELFVDIECRGENGMYFCSNLRVFQDAKHTLQWLHAHKELWDGIEGY